MKSTRKSIKNQTKLARLAYGQASSSKLKSKIIFLAAALLAVFASCKKDDPAGTEPDSAETYAAFKADDTPRWENGTTVEKNENTAYVFICDAGGHLFSSSAYKTGRMAADGSSFEIVEFNGSPAVGNPSSATLRTQAGSITLHRIEILKIENSKLWMVFQETKTSAERRIVQ